MSACAVMYLLSASGCTTPAAYEAVRRNVRNDCYKLPSDAEVARCLARTQDSFEEYRRKREAVIRQADPRKTG
ncbi:MAG: hypothetical protein HC872_03725 [Gammaproteobacteria bacterium]|nr:hypothetical protein [Gammaproteobacteria bacterium]